MTMGLRTRTCAPIGLSRIAVLLLAASPACGDDSGQAEGAGTDASDSSSAGEGTTAGVDSSSSTGEPGGFCMGPSMLQYDPLAQRIDAFPDDFFTVDDDGVTGVRVDLRPGENVTLDGASMSFASLFEDASTIDGFGTTGGVFLRIDASLDAASLPPALNEAPEPDDAVLLVDLDADPPALVPFAWKQIAEDPGESATTLLIEPLAPLRPIHRHGLVLTRNALDASGACIAPSPAMRSLLDGSAADPGLARMLPRVTELIDVLVAQGSIAGPEDVSAAVAFTTEHTIEDSATIAAEIRDGDAPVFTAVGDCVDGGSELAFVKCTATLDVVDYTGEDEAVADDLSPQGGYALPVSIWLPKDATAPYPSFVYGHGLGGDRDEAEALAEFAAPIGFAVIAVDAPKHGAHPDAPSGPTVLAFFGLSLDLSNPLDALQLRDNFRQGTYDRLQLVRAVLEGIDADGDGETDLDAERLHYLGVSLGGIMGAELTAYAPELDTATLIVPGARVGNIVLEGAAFELVLNYFKSMSTDGELQRFFPILQTVIDRGDAGVSLRHVVRERLPGFDEATPQLLMQMVIGDDTVPNSANSFYARGLGVPLVGDELLEVGLIAHEQELPTAANFDADHTWGLFQFDIDETGMPTSHGSIARSQVAQTQIVRFVQSYLDDGLSEILDPYRELGIK
jgi:pimeloyl-ACP methyl ester carboxylesterase